ncbi:IclR family transcriptional regulator [Occultella aeris]|uniref:Glycerol operon regulatory protein n=1 Tax=Occultella aeris TaxID=2761496 RepID=A0A7M4DNX6_9MICO|nr:HTH-type transcriptional repressor AllR [Occultella aeris]
MVDNERRTGAPALARGLRVLELLADSESLSLTEVAVALDLPKSSAHHLIGALIDAGWAERDPATMRVTLGLRAWEVGQAYDGAQSLSQRARPFMDAVRDATGETVRLAIRSGADQVCLAKSHGTHKLVFDQRIGARLPCHATGLGKALLTALDDAGLTELYGNGELEVFTEHTRPDVASLRADVSAARARGWAEDDGEYILGIRCVAVPVFDRVGEVVAALSVSGTTARFSAEQADRCRHELQQAAGELAQRLGEHTLPA